MSYGYEIGAGDENLVKIKFAVWSGKILRAIEKSSARKILRVIEKARAGTFGARSGRPRAGKF